MVSLCANNKKSGWRDVLFAQYIYKRTIYMVIYRDCVVLVQLVLKDVATALDGHRWQCTN